MKKFILAVLAFILFSQAYFSQTPGKEKTLVEISTTLIQIDVTVTDKKGKIIDDLTAADFEIYENDRKQKITNFTFVSAQPDADNAALDEIENLKIAAPPPVRELKPDQIRRTIAVVVDDLSFSVESINYVKKTLKNFVAKQMQPGDLVAIVRASGGLGALQQFTANKSYLYESIDKIRWRGRGAGKMSTFDPFSMASGGLDPNEARSNEGSAEGDLESFRRSVYASGTLGAMKYLVDAMDKLPGRKSIMLMSDGFQIFARGDSGFRESSRVSEVLKHLVEAANKSSVVIYTMDTRGLQTLDFTAADDLGSRPIYNPTDPSNQVVAITQDKTEKITAGRRAEFFDSRDGLSFLAKETGGVFIRDTNDLYGGIKKMLEAQSYYLLAYEPDGEFFDAEKRRFNKLDIRVNRADTEMRYRSGFFATGGSGEPKKNPAAENSNANERLNNALISPFPVSDIGIKLSSLFQGSDRKNLFINSFIYIDIADLEFTDSGTNGKKAEFDLLAANFNDNGVPTDRQNKTFTLDVKTDVYERMLKEGFIYYFTLPVKEAGAYQMRVAIRDRASNKIGSANQMIGVPKLKNKEIALSGIALDNIPYKKWNAGVRSSRGRITTSQTDVEEDLPTLTDSAKRIFRRGTVLRYGLEVYNAGAKKKKKSELLFRTRVFHDNRVIYEGNDTFVDIRDLSKEEAREIAGAINIGTEIPLGAYVLQIIVTAKEGGKDRQIATQFVQFEVTE